MTVVSCIPSFVSHYKDQDFGRGQRAPTQLSYNSIKLAENPKDNLVRPLS